MVAWILLSASCCMLVPVTSFLPGAGFLSQNSRSAWPLLLSRSPPKVLLFATSSKELRKKEADEKEARVKRRQKTKDSQRKTSAAAKVKVRKIQTVKGKSEAGSTAAAVTAKSKAKKKKKSTVKTTKEPATGGTKLQKSVLTKRLQQATARAKAAALEAEQANQQQQMQDSLMSTGDPRRSQSSIDDNNRHNDGNSASHGNNASNQTDTDQHLGTLTQLTKIIDMELLSASDGSATFNVHGTTNPPPGVTQDSMRSLLEENKAQWTKRKRQQQRHATTNYNNNNLGYSNSGPSMSQLPPQSKVRHIAVVISKPLVQDQVTLEYACRLRALAKAIMPKDEQENNIGNANKAMDDEEDDMDERNYRPSIICFVGETTSGNLVSDADAGYIYFNHLCASNQISLEGIDILLEKTTLGKGALKRVMRHLRQEYIGEWLQDDEDAEELMRQQSQLSSETSSENGDDDEDEESEIQLKRRQQQTKKMQLHFTLFSCDYDLCRLNNIHYRSPQKSVLRPLLEAAEDDDHYMDDDAPSSLITYSRSGAVTKIQDYSIDTSWSYRYTSYPYIHVKDSMTSFLGKCYLLAEELTPVLVNIRAVVDGTEFFQRDNFRVLVSIRRSLVNDMERFYQNQPSLKSTLRQFVSRNDYPLDIVLEGALLSLGRCLDLVRPAGLLIGYVSNSDWKNAEMVLEHAVSQMRDACDPDHPLDPADWGKLEHHYDQPKDTDMVASSEEDLASLTHWRLEDGEEVEGELEEDMFAYDDED